jgi:hypothetical protein
MGLLLLLGGSDFSGALDTLGTGLESAWSVGRRLRAAYSGPIIRVRESVGNTERDFSGSGASGAVDPAAVAAFCGAGDGFLTTIYDQSGLTRNLTQSTTTRQPQVVSSGSAITQNGKLTAQYAAAAVKLMQVGSSTATYKFLHGTGQSTISLVASVNDTAATKTLARTINFSGAENGVIVNWTSSESLYAQFSANSTLPALRNIVAGSTSAQMWTLLLDLSNATLGSRLVMWKDTAVQSVGLNTQNGTAADVNANQNFGLGADWSAGSGFDGTISEFVIWSADQTSNRSVFESSAKTFWGTP